MSFIIRSPSFFSVSERSKKETIISKKILPLDEHVFFYDVDVCKSLTDNWNNKTVTMSRLSEIGGVQGLSKALRTDLNKGIYADEIENNNYSKRIKEFGENIYKKKPIRPFILHCVDGFKDIVLIILLIIGVVSIVVGTIDDPASGYYEGVAIFITVIVVVLITAGNNYNKELKFRSLDKQNDQKDVIVIRNNKEMLIKNKEILVGDIIVLSTGVSVPCDGVWVTGTNDLLCEESSLTGESISVSKNFYSPLFLSGTSIVSGEGIMIATSVGERTVWGTLLSKLDEKRRKTPLQKKLQKMVKFIGYLGLLCASVLFLVKIGIWIYEIVTTYSESDKTTLERVRPLLEIFIIVVTIVVVAIPEGLPLAVTISLAYSMKKMYKDQNFVRHLSACETMGNATTICSDKTGTLTQNKMTVVKTWPDIIKREKDMSVKFIDNNKPSEEFCNCLFEGISLNSKVFELDKSQWKDPNVLELTGGNETECALLHFAIDIGVDYMSQRKTFLIEKAYPFSSKTKRSAVLVRYRDKYRIYLKGAAERVIKDLCTSYINPEGTIIQLTNETKEDLLLKTEEMVSTGLRCICLAYKEFETIEYEDEIKSVPKDKQLEDFVCVLIAGIKDPIREDVKSSVRKCQESGIIVRMVTGDHPKTAEFIAAECGIRPKSRTDLLIFTGEEFRSMDSESLEKNLPKLRVLARSTPADKEAIVKWYMDHNDIVAVTGDGANDALALKEAHVGLAMGIQGTDVAKEASDIIILDDSFSSIVETVKWGRCVFDNIRKFIQFQLTINLVALAISIIGAIVQFPLPLTAVQLLWVNLIMDTLAALALGTESPTDDLLKRKPYKLNCKIVSRFMWRAIIGQSVIQLIILLIIILPKSNPMGLTIFMINTIDKKEQIKILRTCIFNTFVCLQIFNAFNTRKVNDEINIFKNIFSNLVFIYILLFIITLQIIIVSFFDGFANVVPLNIFQWLICIAIGTISIPVGFLLHFIKLSNKNDVIKSEGDRDIALMDKNKTE